MKLRESDKNALRNHSAQQQIGRILKHGADAEWVKEARLFLKSFSNDKRVTQDQKIWIEKKGNSNTPYLCIHNVDKKHCSVCLKEKPTQSHHLIPKRANAKNSLLANIRVRVCEDCDEIIHAENGLLDGFEIIKRQAKKIQKLHNEKAGLYAPFIKIINDRIEELADGIHEIPEKLKETPKKIHPAMKKVEGRIKELRKLRTIVKLRIRDKPKV